MMKKKRILALCLSLCLALSPMSVLGEATTEHTHTEASSSVTSSQPIMQADGLSLPETYMLGEPLFVGLSDGSAPAYWQYDIAEIGASEIYACSKEYDGAAANDAGTAAVRALKCWRFAKTG